MFNVPVVLLPGVLSFFQFCSPAGCHTPVKHDKIRTGVQQSWKGYKHDEIHTDYEFKRTMPQCNGNVPGSILRKGDGTADASIDKHNELG